MKLSTENRKRLFIVLVIFGLLYISSLLYDLIQNWHSLSNFKLFMWPLQIISWAILIIVFYLQFKKSNTSKPSWQRPGCHDYHAYHSKIIIFKKLMDEVLSGRLGNWICESFLSINCPMVFFFMIDNCYFV